MTKLEFLRIEFPKLARSLAPESKGHWGVLNAQQMVEHMSDSVRIANGKDPHTLHTPVDQVAKYKEFAMSDKEFKPNTKNVLMGEIPVPAKHPAMEHAVKEYEQEIADFVAYFDKNPGITPTNPFFGDLNKEEWIHLLHKHAVHHSKQFGLL